MGIELVPLIQGAGYVGLFAIVFAESGILIGAFLPGDSLLFTAGILASQGYFDIVALSALLFCAAVLGDNVGYAFGKRVGPRIFQREDSWLFHKDNLLRANQFFHKHGGKTLILARFTPVIRTFAPILAGVGKMHYRTFFLFNIVGAFLWAVGLTALGYFVGAKIPGVEKYIVPVAVVIIFVSLLPQILHILRHKEDRLQLWRGFVRLWRRFFSR